MQLIAGIGNPFSVLPSPVVSNIDSDSEACALPDPRGGERAGGDDK